MGEAVQLTGEQRLSIIAHLARDDGFKALRKAPDEVTNELMEPIFELDGLTDDLGV